MDKVDARTRETAVTLLDVRWTSKAAGGAAKSSTTLAANAVNPSKVMAENSIACFPTQVGTNTGVLGSAPIKTALRHGFDTNGWGNETTVQNNVSTQRIPIGNQFTNQVEKILQPQKPEQDTQTISEQQRQPQPSKTVASISSASIVPKISVQNQEDQLQRQNQEKRFKQQQQDIERNLDRHPSKKFQQNGFRGANNNTMTSNITSNSTTPMMISMTSIGFGIDNNNTSRVDATEATIKAVKDAMERSTLRFHAFHSHSLQIKIQLGVPCVGTQASSLGSSDPKVNQMRPMNVDLARLSSILPRVIQILPVQVEPGGLFVPGETSGAPSICTVVACITLESQPQPLALKPQSQPEPSPRTSVVPPLPPCSPLALESSTTAGFPNPKQALSMTSVSTAKRMIYTPADNQETRQKLSSAQVQNQPASCLLTSTLAATQQIEGSPIPPKQWDRGNCSNNYSPEIAPIPSLSLLYRTQVNMRSPGSSTDEIGILGEKNLRETTTTPPSSNECNITCGTISVGNKRQLQHQRSNECGQKKKLRVDGKDNKETTKSIEMLAMISEQEINRRSVLRASDGSTATLAPSSRVLYSVFPTNGSVNKATFQNEEISKDHFATPGVDKKNGAQNTTTISTTGTSNLTTPANVRQPPNLGSRQSNKLDTSRGGRAVSYLDYSNEHPLPEERDCWALSTRTTSSPVFPLKLHETLTQIEKDGYDDIIGWLPHGRSFKIYKQKEFTDIILPRYANMFLSS